MRLPACGAPAGCRRRWLPPPPPPLATALGVSPLRLPSRPPQGEHMHHGFYRKGAPPKSNQQAQIDMIEETLRFAGVEGASKVRGHPCVCLCAWQGHAAADRQGGDRGPPSSCCLRFHILPRSLTAPTDGRRRLRHRRQQPLHRGQVWVRGARHHAEPRPGEQMAGEGRGERGRERGWDELRAGTPGGAAVQRAGGRAPTPLAPCHPCRQRGQTRSRRRKALVNGSASRLQVCLLSCAAPCCPLLPLRLLGVRGTPTGRAHHCPLSLLAMSLRPPAPACRRPQPALSGRRV